MENLVNSKFHWIPLQVVEREDHSDIEVLVVQKEWKTRTQIDTHTYTQESE